MPKQYRSRTVDVVALNTKTAMTTLGSETAPGALIVPQGASKLEAVIVAAGWHVTAAGRANAMLRIEGSGLPNGPETVVITGVGHPAAVAAAHITEALRVPIGSPVTPGNEILLSAEMLGFLVGDVQVAATLVFA